MNEATRRLGLLREVDGRHQGQESVLRRVKEVLIALRGFHDESAGLVHSTGVQLEIRSSTILAVPPRVSQDKLYRSHSRDGPCECLEKSAHSGIGGVVGFFRIIKVDVFGSYD